MRGYDIMTFMLAKIAIISALPFPNVKLSSEHFKRAD